MANAEDDHGHLDTWGRMRRDAIQEWGSTASAYMQAGGRWNKVKSFVAGAYEAAAELAPHSKWGLALDVGAIVATPVVAGLAAARAGKALLHGAEAVHKTLEIAHLSKSIAESAHVVATNAKPFAKEVKSILGSGRPAGSKGGSSPASAPAIKLPVIPHAVGKTPITLPAITIKAGSRAASSAAKSGPTTQGSHMKLPPRVVTLPGGVKPSAAKGGLKITQATTMRLPARVVTLKGGAAHPKPSVMKFAPTVITLPGRATPPAIKSAFQLRPPTLGHGLFRRMGPSSHPLRPKLGGFQLRHPTVRPSPSFGSHGAAQASAAARMRLHAPRPGTSMPMRPMVRQPAPVRMSRPGGPFRR